LFCGENIYRVKERTAVKKLQRQPPELSPSPQALGTMSYRSTLPQERGGAARQLEEQTHIKTTRGVVATAEMGREEETVVKKGFLAKHMKLTAKWRRRAVLLRGDGHLEYKMVSGL
jgi:hypothetical protein